MSDGSVSACGSGHRALPEYSGKVLLAMEVWSLNFLEVHGQTRLTAMSDSHGHPKGSGQGGLTHKKGSHQARESFGRVGKTRRQTGKVKWEEPLKCLGFWGSGVCGTEADGVIQWRRALLETLDGGQ